MSMANTRFKLRIVLYNEKLQQVKRGETMIIDAFTISVAVIALVVIVTIISLMRAHKFANKMDD